MGKPGRHLSIKIEMESLTNIYAPNIPKKRKHFFQKLETNNNNNILGEDFNMVENIQKDRAGGNPTTQHYGLEYIENIKKKKKIIRQIFGESNTPRKKNTPTLII